MGTLGGKGLMCFDYENYGYLFTVSNVFFFHDESKIKGLLISDITICLKSILIVKTCMNKKGRKKLEPKIQTILCTHTWVTNKMNIINDNLLNIIIIILLKTDDWVVISNTS